MEPLHTQEWMPTAETRAGLLLVHGYAEHAGRYSGLARLLNASGIHVYAYDQLGHGRSRGKRGYIARFDALVADLATQVARVVALNDGKPLFLLGHSMGGLVVTNFLATRPNELAGAIVSSPLLAVGDVPAWKIRASGWLSRWTPWLPVERLNSAFISRDESEVQAYRDDPLVYHGPIVARTGCELLNAIQATLPRLKNIDVPLLVLHGTADKLAPFSGGKQLYDKAGSASRCNYWEDGGYHELLNDLNRDKAMAAIVSWIDDQLG